MYSYTNIYIYMYMYKLKSTAYFKFEGLQNSSTQLLFISAFSISPAYLLTNRFPSIENAIGDVRVKFDLISAFEGSVYVTRGVFVGQDVFLGPRSAEVAHSLHGQPVHLEHLGIHLRGQDIGGFIHCHH